MASSWAIPRRPLRDSGAGLTQQNCSCTPESACRLIPSPDCGAMGRMEQVGITTTVPAEILYAAGARPIDLNNAFVTSAEPASLVNEAERLGFPRNMCAWIKGIYATARRLGIGRVIGVVQGDCSNTLALMEVFESEGVEVIPFAFPHSRAAEELGRELSRLAERLGTTLDAAERKRREFAPIRQKLLELDQLSWEAGKVTGQENHLWLVSSSDFGGEPRAFESALGRFLAEAHSRMPQRPALRLGYVGVPPICTGLYDFLEELGARVVFNEVQRQFAMPYVCTDLVEQYLRYTYPYGIFARLNDIETETLRRDVHGLIHYVQSFCFRGVEDRILREWAGRGREPLPVLTLECDRPGELDERTRTRLEAFVDMLVSARVKP